MRKIDVAEYRSELVERSLAETKGDEPKTCMHTFAKRMRSTRGWPAVVDSQRSA